MDKLTIRQYQKSDFEQVWDLHVLALKQTGAFVGNGRWDEDFKDIEGIYINGGGDFLVGIIGKKIVAIGAIKKIDETTAELKRMRVDPDFQGQGFGQIMLEVLEKRARELGYKEIILDTTNKQEVAQNLYSKNGYKETNRKFINPPGLEFIYYKKELAQ